MSNVIELKVPDIGGHDNVDIIEVFVKVGDTIAIDDSLITLETDKASMEVPSTATGVVKEMKVKVGDKISEGGTILLLEIATQASEAAPAQASAAPAAAISGDVIECDVMVLGGGPGGYSAAFRSADLGMKTVLVERYGTLGGVCLNVGCIPSKALLHNAALIDEVSHLEKNGIKFGKPEVDIDALRGYKEKVIGKLTSGLAGMAKMRNVEYVRGIGRFLDANHLEVQLTTGKSKDLTGKIQIIKFKQAIIAAGSYAVKLPFIPDDPRVIDSTGALELKNVPKRMLIIGGGIIGLEMGTVYSTLGARLDVVELADGLMLGADRDLVKVWQNWNKHRFDNIMLQSKTTSIVPKEDGVWVTFEGPNVPKEPQCYDIVLYSTGRAPNGKSIGAENAGINVDERGFIQTDKQQRTNVPHIFAIGDIIGQPMLAHKAVHEAHIAAENAAGHEAWFDARVIPGVAYTDPEVAWVGLTEDQAKKDGIAITKGVFPWAASGRAIANGRDEGFTKLIFDAENGQILGGAIVGPHAGDMIGEICLGIEMGADAIDIGKTIHPHPTMGESIGMAAEVAKGVCTDLPPQRKK
ncbi:dihydrolipoamide dehydrogenase [Formivibrio citricus]|uniref:Dihydrolipoyl dehydrogenase n=1 Tax=Formivibrio citricus TaxID=83765 RepID=A0A1I4WVA1_9NEIS|nr:dihydrolipoyl dehydrogenase [Formivibrio citricus]SFN17738.1 dihydrolipoamide dehydrogenase [Formivibrio citricus]